MILFQCVLADRMSHDSIDIADIFAYVYCSIVHVQFADLAFDWETTVRQKNFWGACLGRRGITTRSSFWQKLHRHGYLTAA